MKDKDKTPFEPENFEQLYYHLFNRVTDAIYYLQEVQAELEDMYVRMLEKEEQRPLGTLLEWPLRFSTAEDGQSGEATSSALEDTTEGSTAEDNPEKPLE